MLLFNWRLGDLFFAFTHTHTHTHREHIQKKPQIRDGSIPQIDTVKKDPLIKLSSNALSSNILRSLHNHKRTLDMFGAVIAHTP